MDFLAAALSCTDCRIFSSSRFLEPKPRHVSPIFFLEITQISRPESHSGSGFLLRLLKLAAGQGPDPFTGASDRVPAQGDSGLLPRHPLSSGTVAREQIQCCSRFFRIFNAWRLDPWAISVHQRRNLEMCSSCGGLYAQSQLSATTRAEHVVRRKAQIRQLQVTLQRSTTRRVFSSCSRKGRWHTTEEVICLCRARRLD
jgi:hypothetical protein